MVHDRLVAIYKVVLYDTVVETDYGIHLLGTQVKYNCSKENAYKTILLKF